MAIEINGKVYRNLEEQVRKNQEDIKELGGGSELTLHERVAKLEEDVEALTSLVNAIKEKTDYITVKVTDTYKSFNIDLGTDNVGSALTIYAPLKSNGSIEYDGALYLHGIVSLDEDPEVGGESLSVINVEDATKVLGN